MKSEKFSELVRKIHEKELKILDSKGIEYSEGLDDRLSNFKFVGEMLDIDPKKVLLIYMYKHVSSLISFVKTNKTFSDEPIEERLFDIRNYCALMNGLIEDEREDSS